MRVDEISNAKLLKIRSYTENFNIFRGGRGKRDKRDNVRKKRGGWWAGEFQTFNKINSQTLRITGRCSNVAGNLLWHSGEETERLSSVSRVPPVPRPKGI